MTSRGRIFGATGLVAAAGGFASLLMLWVTKQGPGVSPDSAVYLQTADSLLAGKGFFAGGQPMTHYAPVYPLLLALAARLQDGDLLQAGRLLCVLLYGANVALLGVAVLVGTEGSTSAAGCAMLTALAAPHFLSAHAMAWSEAPFLLLALGAFIMTSLHIARPGRLRLLAAALCAGGAVATRYAGISVVPPLVCALLLIGDRPIGRRALDALLVGVAAMLPLAAWLARNVVAAGTTIDRQLAVHAVGARHFREFAATLRDFALPVAIPLWAGAVLLAVASVLLVQSLARALRRSRQPSGAAATALPALCLLFFLTYAALLVVSLSLVDAWTPLDARILLPANVALLVAGICLVRRSLSAAGSRGPRIVLVLLVLAAAAANIPRTAAEAVDIRENGREYASRAWRTSPTLAAARSLAKDLRIYSNGPEAIGLLAAREASSLPRLSDPGTGRPDPDYRRRLHVVCQAVERGEAAIVFFAGVTWRSYLPTPEEVEAACLLPVLGRMSDGVIYGRRAGERAPSARP